MRTKLVWFLVQVAPVVASVMGMATFSVCAAESVSSPESDRSPTVPTAALPAEPLLTELLATEAQELSPSPTVFQTWTDHGSEVEWQISDVALENLASNREDLPDANQPDRLPVSDLPEEAMANVSFSATEMQLPPISPSELQPFSHEGWQIAQAEDSPASDDSSDESEAQDDSETQDESEAPSAPEPEATSHSPRWRITFTPYGFVPLNVNGSATVRDFTADINLGLDDILSPLNFAAAGRVEVWRGNLGFIFDGAYFDIGQEDSRSLPIPNCLCNIFPSKIDTEVNVQYGQFDLGVGYRVGANLSNAATEFDMGPLVFDAIVGMRIYALHQEIDISTNVGTNRNLENSNTLVEPLISGRLRWNVAPKLAGWVRGDLAGFGIGGNLMAASVTGGLDWMFSGNTSLLLAYRFSSLRYNTEIRGEDFDLDLLMQGPYMGILFRF